MIEWALIAMVAIGSMTVPVVTGFTDARPCEVYAERLAAAGITTKYACVRVTDAEYRAFHTADGDWLMLQALRAAKRRSP